MSLSSVRAQRSDFKYIHKFSVKEGLSSYNIRKIARDEYGYMWVATQEGLNRFDGRQFLRYNSSSPTPFNLAASDIRDLFCDSMAHELWILTNVDGLFRISTTSGSIISHIPIPYTRADDWSHCFLFVKDRIWIGGMNGIKLYDRKATAWLADPQIGILPSANHDPLEIGALLDAGDGKVISFINGYGIAVLDISTGKTLAVLPESNYNRKAGKLKYAGALEFSHANFITGSTAGPITVQLMAGNSLLVTTAQFPILQQLDGTVSSLAKTANGEVLLGLEAGTVKLDANLRDLSWIKDKEGASENSDWLGHVKSLLDDGQYLWAGSKEGLCYLSNQSFASEIYSSGTPAFAGLSHVFDVEAIDKSRLLVGTKKGLFIIDRVQKTSRELLSDAVVNNTFPDPNAGIFVSTSKGNFRYANDRLLPWSVAYPELKSFEHSLLVAGIPVSDSIMLLATDDESGLIKWNRLRKTTSLVTTNSKPVSIGSATINGLFKTRNGESIVLGDKIISILDKGLQHSRIISIRDTNTGKDMGPFFDITETDSSYWICAYGNGLLKLNKDWQLKKIYAEHSGLTNSGVYKVFNDDDHFLYITSNNGITVFDLKDQRSKFFFEEDGLHANSFEEASGSYSNGEIFAGGPHGFSVIRPSLTNYTTEKLQIFINRYSIRRLNGPSLDSLSNKLDRIIIPNDYSQATVHFAAIGFENPSRIDFQYRLSGLQKEWIDLGNQDFIDLIGIAPGSYRLEMRASSNSGPWSESKTVELIFQPHWYQTWVFKAVVLLALMALLYAVYQFRIRQIRKEEAIRARLGTDLHDDLGSTLNSVKVYANLAMMEDQPSTHLLKIKESAQEAISGIRDMIWVLDDKKNAIEDLLSRISQFAKPFCEANGIQFTVHSAPDSTYQNLTSAEKRNLFLIMKEFVNNTVKYSGATELTIKAANKNGKQVIELEDNGRGFDPVNNKEGHGLGNMRFRAKEIKFQFAIETAAGNGVRISLQKN